MEVLIILFLVSIILIVFLVFLVWLSKPKKYHSCSLNDLYQHLKSFAEFSDDKSYLYIDHKSLKVPLKFQKRVYVSRSNVYMLHFGGSVYTRDQINSVYKSLSESFIDTKLILTKKLSLPKEVQCPIKIDDTFFTTNLANLVNMLLSTLEQQTISKYSIWTNGEFSFPARFNEKKNFIPPINIIYYGMKVSLFIAKTFRFFRSH